MEERLAAANTNKTSTTTKVKTYDWVIILWVLAKEEGPRFWCRREKI